MPKVTQKLKSQKGQQVMNFTEEQARDYFERMRWPEGPGCVHCGSINVYRLQGKSQRPGLFECRDCKKNFTVTVGTVMEDTHLPLATWARAFHLMASSKKGISALQLQRNLGLGSYKTAWHLAHRIRLAMKVDTEANQLQGDVQVDETYVGGKPRNRSSENKRGRGTKKAPVVALVETNGRVHSQMVENVSAKTLREVMEKNIHQQAFIVTDELNIYPTAAQYFAAHEQVNHQNGQYVNDAGYHTNTAESYFALLKRGVHGTFHHVSKQHLHRYCSEFDFRWNGRKLDDTVRRDLAVTGSEGKRLMFYPPKGDA